MLFRGTVADNIRLGDAHATGDAVRAAARLAGADEFVRRLPAGYDTIVGDGGRPLSAGEVQRVALARAFLRDAPFVILDEPTANLDPESAALVVDAVERLESHVLLITHRPEAARTCRSNREARRRPRRRRCGGGMTIRRLIGSPTSARVASLSPSSSAR